MDNAIDKAIVFAAIAHAGQKRKGTDIPYITHPAAVGMMLLAAGCPDEQVIAGLLHDTVEDTGTSLEKIEGKFGAPVAAIVQGCSEDKKLGWEQRKLHTLDYIKDAPLAVKTVTLADKLHNIRQMAADFEQQGQSLWKRFNRGERQQKWYYTSLSGSLRDSRYPDKVQELYRELCETVKRLFGD